MIDEFDVWRFQAGRCQVIIDRFDAARAVGAVRSALNRGCLDKGQEKVERSTADFPVIQEVAPGFAERLSGEIELLRQTEPSNTVVPDGFPAFGNDPFGTNEQDFEFFPIKAFQ